MTDEYEKYIDAFWAKRNNNILEVITTDRKEGITHCKVFYRILRNGFMLDQLVGYANINVSKTIKNWKEIEEIFLKTEKTKEEKEKIAEIAKKDWYVEYMIKKHEKMELITKEGIFRPRVLDYAEAILKTIEKLKDLTRMPRLVTKETIGAQTKISFREAKIPTSLIGEEIATREAKSVLDLYGAMWIITGKVRQLKNSDRRNQTTIKLEEETEEMRKNIIKTIENQIQELNKYVEINKKYNRKIAE